MMEQIFFKEPVVDERILSLESAEAEEDTTREEKILCRNCHSFITEKENEIKINNTDFHLFQNPMGVYFRVVCFSYAEGCSIISDYTDEHTWFSGFSWAIVLCRVCHSHLGWHYVSPESSFFGLIADRLTGI